MAVTPTAFADATLTNTLTTTLYTVGANKLAVITSVTVANTSASAVNVTLNLGTKYLFGAVTVAAYSTWTLGPNDLRKVIAAAGTIKGGASTASVVDVTISGVLIDV